MTTYYVRKLYRQRDPFLSKVEDMGEDFSTCLDLEQVLKSQYRADQLDLMARQLETLVKYHQGLTSQSHTSDSQLQDIEQRIFAVLGDSSPGNTSGSEIRTSTPPSSVHSAQPDLTVSKLLDMLNQLQEAGSTYLGSAITTNYLKSSCPDSGCFQQFQIERSQPVTYSGNSSQSLDKQQQELAQKWVKKFVQSCSQVITKFPEIVDLPQLLGQL